MIHTYKVVVHRFIHIYNVLIITNCSSLTACHRYTLYYDCYVMCDLKFCTKYSLTICTDKGDRCHMNKICFWYVYQKWFLKCILRQHKRHLLRCAVNLYLLMNVLVQTMASVIIGRYHISAVPTNIIF